MADQVYQSFCKAIEALDNTSSMRAMGLAVSGGGDSVALMHLAHMWAENRNITLHVAVVDHGLRPESGDEAAFVVNSAKTLGLTADILRWTTWSGRGNLQAEARLARRTLLCEWAAGIGIDSIALGHTMDDQAETVLMRLGRGAGVDGLSAMAPQSVVSGIRWLRPLLGLRRETLRRWLTENGGQWVDDPSNDDLKYDRVRARKALQSLDNLGVTAEGLSKTAEHMQDARVALDHAVAALAEQATKWGPCGDLHLDLSALRAAPEELARRLLRQGLRAVAGTAYGARSEAEAKLMTAMLGLRLGGGRSLHGCIIRPDGPTAVVITREISALDQQPKSFSPAPMLWDGRFQISPRGDAEDAKIAPLGENGVRQLSEFAETGHWTAPPDWRAAPRAAQLATPALWQKETLFAAPLAHFGDAIDAVFTNFRPNWAEPSQEGT